MFACIVSFMNHLSISNSSQLALPIGVPALAGTRLQIVKSIRVSYDFKMQISLLFAGSWFQPSSSIIVSYLLRTDCEYYHLQVIMIQATWPKIQISLPEHVKRNLNYPWVYPGFRSCYGPSLLVRSHSVCLNNWSNLAGPCSVTCDQRS